MIRSEMKSDAAHVRAVHCASFPTTDEADLVDALRNNDHLLVSLVAIDEGRLVGHVAFSPVTIDHVGLVGAGLAPVAVLPSHRGRGLGSELIRAGIETCRRASIDYVVVLGRPEYYRRFGFETASKSGLENEYHVNEEFLVMELTGNCLANVRGLARYGEEFRGLS